MKPDSPDNDQVSGDANKSTSVIVNGGDTSDLPDIDDEVMGFMHTGIHRQLKKLARRGWGKKKEGLMDKETKNYFDEVIRGSALFGLIGQKPDGEEEKEEEEDDPFREEDTENREPTPEDTARSQLSRILLAKKVAEAFMKNKPDDDDDQPASADKGKSGPSGGSTGGWDGPMVAAKENALAPDDYNRPVNPLAPVKLPINQSSEASSGVALEEIRSKLRKTQFDYAADSRSRISEQTPQSVDYRNVLKKKPNA